jgi:nucleoside-diphosphate-sugar epimerase
MANMLIAGCGRLGSAVAKRLVNRGHQIYGLRRRWSAAPTWLRPLTADLHDAPTLARTVPAGLDVVMHVLTPDQRDEAGYRRAYLKSLQTLLALPQLSDPRQRWIFVSSTAVYGDAGGGWVDESTPPAPPGFNGRVLLDAEETLRSARPNAALLRLGGIYGPGRDHLLRQLRSGQLRVQRDPPHWGNRIHADDAAELLTILALSPSRGVFNGVDAHPSTEAAVGDWLAERLGVPAPLLRTSDAARPNRRIAARRLSELDFVHRYPDFRVGYDALLRDAGPLPGDAQ